MATAADLGNAPVATICNIGFISCGTGQNISHFDTIEIKLGQTSASTLSSTFSSNLVTNVQTVLQATNYEWHNTGGQFSTIGLQQDYLYIAAQGANIVIDVCVTGARKSLGGTTGFYTGARQRLYNFGWTGGPQNCPATGTLGSSAALKWSLHLRTASVTVTGLGCNGITVATSGTGALGTSFTAGINSTVPSTAVCNLAIGLSQFNPAFDLGLIGATGCFVYCNPAITLGGLARFQATVPNDNNLICQRICMQFYCLDNSYAGGIATSPSILLIPGN